MNRKPFRLIRASEMTDGPTRERTRGKFVGSIDDWVIDEPPYSQRDDEQDDGSDDDGERDG